ncbi:MAG: GH25 family lysozyme [Sphingorhabdus sp.]|uniref:GH25 family lysozyme n=1 Tax=Sphingorhabdus sp. TaxID=1902408 RepID=UPI003CAE451F
MAGGKFRLWRYAALALALALGAFVLWRVVLGWAPARDDYPVQGIVADARHGKLDWPMLAATGVDFAYILATDGSKNRDTNFATNMAGAREAGVRFGPLHRYDLCRLASDQATLFITTVPRTDAALPAAVEFGFSEKCASKPDRALVLSEVATFLSQIEAHLGKPAILKISQEFENQYKLSSSIDRTVWLEKTWLLPDYAARPWVMWTANPERRIDGVDEPVQWVVVRQ